MKGFTLIEIMIAVAVFMMIAVVITGSIIFSGDLYQESEGMMELSQNGRVVLDGASREIRQAQAIVTPLPDTNLNVDKIIFKDGHLEEISKEGTLQEGGGKLAYFSEGSDQDDFYKNSHIKITGGPEEVVGETRKIVSYDGDEKKVELDFSLPVDDYFGLDYVIDTSHYYISYKLEDGLVKREVFSYYFSGDSNHYVSAQDRPPEGQTLEKELFQSRVVGEHFTKLSFWESGGINISVELQAGERKVDLFKKVVGRNL